MGREQGAGVVMGKDQAGVGDSGASRIIVLGG